MKSFHTVTVGVADLDQVLDLWLGAFGLELIERSSGADQQLAKRWGLNASDVAQQALIATPNQDDGMLHFIEFKNPDKPVRHQANVFDYCPKNLDLYVEDMPKQIARLRSLGYEFRSDTFTEITTDDGMRVREIHMHGHDQINIVLLQRDIEGLQYSSKGFAGIGPLINIVADSATEIEFYKKAIGLQVLEEYDLKGPEIEKMIGLPEGAGLQFSILGHGDAPLGRIEVICYRGVDGNDLFQFAQPKHTGILHVCYRTSDLETLKTQLADSDINYQSHGNIETLAVAGELISLRSPAGFNIDVVQA